jgi:hypothetical protein
MIDHFCEMEREREREREIVEWLKEEQMIDHYCELERDRELIESLHGICLG